MKRVLGLICTVIFASLLLSGTAFAEHTGIQNADELEKSRVVQLLEIMNGDENGNLNLDATVTRAEFVKMAICASTYKNSAGASSAVSIFPDVTSSHWAVGYVSTAINAGLVSGYLDGTFRPENTVKLEEAVIILLKLLGYTNADFSGTYPEAQLAKYEEIDLDTDIAAVRGDVLTRRECMKLIYNALCTKTKSGSYYCTTLGYATDADNTIDYLALLSNSMTGPFVNTEAANWTARVSFAYNPNTAVFRDGKSADTSSADEYDVYYYSDKIKTVWFYSDKAFGKIDAVTPNRETPQKITLGQTSYQLTPTAAKKLTNDGGIAEDDYVMVLLDKDGNAADVILADASLYNQYADKDSDLLTEVNKTISDPIVVRDSAYRDEIPFDIDKAEILLDSEVITSSQIKTDDVLYYSEPFNSVWVFRDTKSGVCSAVSPNKENPTSVTVNGKTYSLSTDDVVYKFSNYGTLRTDMLVTLLLGKDGSVVDAKQADLNVIGDGEDQVSYADVVNSTLKGPYIAKEDGKLLADTQIDAATAVVYKGNSLSSVEEIKEYNVYYYSKLLNTVWVYDKTASGTLESVSPSRMSPTSITISGKAYSLESAQAQYEFSSLGSYDIGDRVTLLLGKDGAAAGVVNAGKVNPVVYGVVLTSGEKKYTDADGKTYTADYVTVFATTGDSYTYETTGSFDEGDAVKVTVSGEKVNISTLSGPSSVSAALSATKAIKNGSFADEAELIEYYNSDIYSTVLESRISGHDISYSDILYFDVNSDGEITKLILDNYTGDLVEYGYLIEVNGSTYTYIIDDAETTYSSGDTRFTVDTGAAYFTKSGNQIKKIGNIHGEVVISVIAGDKAYNSKNKEYEIADNVKVYIVERGEYKVADIDDLKSNKYSYMTGYYDKSSESGGKIRVIVAY